MKNACVIASNPTAHAVYDTTSLQPIDLDNFSFRTLFILDSYKLQKGNVASGGNLEEELVKNELKCDMHKNNISQ